MQALHPQAMQEIVVLNARCWMTLILLLIPVIGMAQEENEELSFFEKITLPNQAIRLMQEADDHFQQGNITEAAASFREAADVFLRLSEGERNSPRIMSHIIRGNAASLLDQLDVSLSEFQEALGTARSFYGKRDHNEFALTLESVAGVLVQSGRAGEALAYAEEALAMRQRIALTPDHPGQVASLQTIADVWLGLGEYGKALPYFERIVTTNQLIAEGHDDAVWAESLANLAVVLEGLGQTEKALPFLEKALAMHQRLAANGDSFSVAIDLMNAGHLLSKLDRADEALERTSESVRMLERLSSDRDSQHLAMALNNLTARLDAVGRHAEATAAADRAAAMAARVYGKRDHPRRVTYLSNQGALRAREGRERESLPFYEDALEMSLRLCDALADNASELAVVESLTSNHTRDDYLSVTRRLPGSDSPTYKQIWRIRAALTRILQRRAAAARGAMHNSPRVRELWNSLQSTRRQLSRLLLRTADDIQTRDERLQELTDRKEALQRDLASLLPVRNQHWDSNDAGPEQLATHLPGHCVFIDLIRYRYAHGTEDRVAQYCAFVLSSGGQPVRVELGDAAPIDAAVNGWRRDLEQDRVTTEHSRTLRQLVWLPIEKQFPDQIRTIYVAPDGDLGRIPFAALPGERRNSVLLETYAFAHVLHGPFLLERADSSGDAAGDDTGGLIVVGGIDYGESVEQFPYLDGTERERRQVLTIAGDRQSASLSGEAATVEKLVDILPGTRYAHLATHGFFAEKLLEQETALSRRRLEEWQYLPGVVSERSGLGVRNPLSYVGLVLANGDVLSGEAVVGLDLSHLQLAVLSACETGLGRRTEGEGIYGLQRAFHLAGCSNVVASLWKVNDEATAALMARFYHELWVHQQPPVDALRAAQLMVYRRPDLISDLAGSRGEIRLTEALQTKPTDAPQVVGSATRRTPARYWAGFVLSGAGE